MNMILLCLCLSLLAVFHNHWGPEHRGHMFTWQQHVFSLNVFVWLLVKMFCEEPVTINLIDKYIENISFMTHTKKCTQPECERKYPNFSHHKSKNHIQYAFYWNAVVKISCFEVKKKNSVSLALFFCQGDLVSHTVLSFTQTLPFSHHMWKRKKTLLQNKLYSCWAHSNRTWITT